MFGVGGGIVIVPGLLTVLSMERRRAHGTSLSAAMLLAAASLTTYAIGGHVDWPVAACLAAGAMCGSIVGTHLLQIIPKRPLVVIFIAVILLTSIRLLLSSEAMGRNALTLVDVAEFVGIGLGTGVLSGLLGIGGGVIMVPAMVVLLSLPPVLAKGTSVAVIVPSAIVGTLRNRAKNNVDLRVGLTIGLSGIVSAVIGSLIAGRLSAPFSNAMFAILLGIVALIQIRTLLPVRRPPDDERPGDVRAGRDRPIARGR